MLNITSALANLAYGEDLEQEQDQEQAQEQDQRGCFTDLTIQEEFMNEETEALNEKGRVDLFDLYKNNQNFREEIIIFVGGKTGLNNE